MWGVTGSQQEYLLTLRWGNVSRVTSARSHGHPLVQTTTFSEKFRYVETQICWIDIGLTHTHTTGTQLLKMHWTSDTDLLLFSFWVLLELLYQQLHCCYMRWNVGFQWLLFNWLIVWSKICQEMLTNAHQCFLKPKTTSLNCFVPTVQNSNKDSF